VTIVFLMIYITKEKKMNKKQLVSNIKKLTIKEIEQIIVLLQKHVLNYYFPKNKKGERKMRDAKL